MWVGEIIVFQYKVISVPILKKYEGCMPAWITMGCMSIFPACISYLKCILYIIIQGTHFRRVRRYYVLFICTHIYQDYRTILRQRSEAQCSCITQSLGSLYTCRVELIICNDLLFVQEIPHSKKEMPLGTMLLALLLSYY